MSTEQPTSLESPKPAGGWSVYKPGQGYYTRLFSGVGAGILVVAGAQWVWTKLSVIQQDWAIYLQGGAAMLIVAVLGVVVYYYVAVKPSSSDFLIATEGEMKKVNWPSGREVRGSTIVVILTVVVIMTLLFTADLVFSSLFRLLRILDV